MVKDLTGSTYAQIIDVTEKMADLDEMLPNLDDLEVQDSKFSAKDMEMHLHEKIN